MSLLITETEKGAPCIIINNHKFRHKTVIKSGDIRWSCTSKSCKAMCLTDGEMSQLLGMTNEHNHPGMTTEAVEATVFKAACKRQAVEALGVQPKVIIRSHLGSAAAADNSVIINDANRISINTRKAIYRARRKLLSQRRPDSADGVRVDTISEV